MDLALLDGEEVEFLDFAIVGFWDCGGGEGKVEDVLACLWGRWVSKVGRGWANVKEGKDIHSG